MIRDNVILVDTEDLKQIIRETVFEAVNECMPQKVNPEVEFYTTKEVAEKWKITPQTVWKYTKLGMLKCTYAGRHVRFDRNYIDNLTTLGNPKDGGMTYWTKVDQIFKKGKK